MLLPPLPSLFCLHSIPLQLKIIASVAVATVAWHSSIATRHRGSSCTYEQVPRSLPYLSHRVFSKHAQHTSLGSWHRTAVLIIVTDMQQHQRCADTGSGSLVAVQEF